MFCHHSETLHLISINLVKIDLDKVKNERINTNGPFQIQRIAQHYGIFEHLFEDGYFVPRIPLNISVSTKYRNYIFNLKNP